MNLIAVLKRVLPFFAGLAIGIVPAWLLSSANSSPVTSFQPEYSHGRTFCKSRSDYPKAVGGKPFDGDKLRIYHKPKPGYTDEARLGNVEGTVVLRVEFQASGQIGSVEAVTTLPDGLTEQAIAAARRIEFDPAERDGIPVTIVKQVEYSFSIY